VAWLDAAQRPVARIPGYAGKAAVLEVLRAIAGLKAESARSWSLQQKYNRSCGTGSRQ